jgi:hypothetical protein
MLPPLLGKRSMRRLRLLLLSLHALYKLPAGMLVLVILLLLDMVLAVILDKLLLVLTRCVDRGCVGLLGWAGLCVGE